MSASRVHLGIASDARTLLEDAGVDRRHSPESESGSRRLFDAAALLRSRPEHAGRRSLVLDLAYEEFCRRLEAGEAVDRDAFCRRFAPFEKSLRKLLLVYDLVEQNSQAIAGEPPDWPEPGQVVEGFTVLGEIGRGAFARVYLAEEIALGNRLCVVKLSTDGVAEAALLGKLDHPNIVPVYSVRQEAQTGRTIVCMPYLGSVTLFDLLDALRGDERRRLRARAILDAIEALGPDRLPRPNVAGDEPLLKHASFVDGAVYLVSQLAEGLAYSHSKGICHSDLKPSNVLLSPRGRPMLLDFNLAFDLCAAERRLGGTLPYMAPELISALARRPQSEATPVDQRSDVFSLGVLLYEFLSGRLPFPAVPADVPKNEIAARMLENRASGPVPLREANADVDSFLAALVEGCLAYEPDDRPQSADLLATALRRCISPAARARRWSRRHPRLLLCAAAGILLPTLTLGYWLGTRDPYAVRQLKRGAAAYARGQYPEAAEHFTQAIDSDRAPAQAHFDRARAVQRAGRFPQAISDYDRVLREAPSPMAFACRAYCWAVEGVFGNSIDDSLRAIEGGLATAEVYNNLGYCYLRRSQFSRARQALDEALRQAPRLRQALHNRALGELRWSAFDHRHVLDEQAGRDICLAIEVGPPTASLYLDAARVLLRLGDAPERHHDRIAHCVEEALRLGAGPEILQREFPTFVKRESDSALPSGPDAGETRRTIDHLADPLRDDLSPIP